MTQQQVEEIIAMPFGRRLLFLNDKRRANKWTQEQYERVLRMVAGVASQSSSQAASQSDAPPEPPVQRPSEPVVPSSGGVSPSQEVTPQEFIAAFAPHASVRSTHHPDVSKGLSQCEIILGLMQDGQWHDTVELMNAVVTSTPKKVGIVRIASRINDLRNAGHNIETKRVRGTLWAYRLIKPTPAFYGG